MKKLKNKETGEIGELQITEKHYAVVVGNGAADCNAKLYSSLADLNEEWEDAPEEPRGFWSISGDATIEYYDRLNENDRCKEIGNYFDTREEVEKAVEKLKAWKRLKDKGFRFQGWEDLEAIELPIKHYSNIVGFRLEDNHDVIVDLNTIFGGEE